MKIVVIGGTGTVGKAVVANLQQRHQVIVVGKTSGEYQVDLTNDASVKSLFKQIGTVDAIACATGYVHFGMFKDMTAEQFNYGLQDKLLGQVRLVLIGKDYLNSGGSFTLITGILAQQPIKNGVNATAVNKAIEGFALAAANELLNQRINVVSPSVLTESLAVFGDAFPGFESVPASRAALAYQRSIEGIDTGKVFRVL